MQLTEATAKDLGSREMQYGFARAALLRAAIHRANVTSLAERNGRHHRGEGSTYAAVAFCRRRSRTSIYDSGIHELRAIFLASQQDMGTQISRQLSR